MSERELFKIAIKYIEKGYSTEQLRYGDDLYEASSEDRDSCIEIYEEIRDNGLLWAYEHIQTLT